MTAFKATAISGSITRTTAGHDYFRAGVNITIDSGSLQSTGQIIVTSTSADPTAAYLVLNATSSLSNERVLTGTNGITTTDGGAGGAFTLQLDGTVARISGSAFEGAVSTTNTFTSTATSGYIHNNATPVDRIGLLAGSGSGSAASAGNFRVHSAWEINARNAADDADIGMIGTNSSDELLLGGFTSAMPSNAVHGVTASGVHQFRTQNSTQASISATGLAVDKAITVRDSMSVTGSTGYVAIGTVPATSGSLRFAHGATSTGRTTSNDADYELFSWGKTATNVATFGDRSQNGDYVRTGGSRVILFAGAAQKAAANASGFNVTGTLEATGMLNYGGTNASTLGIPQRVVTIEQTTGSSGIGTTNILSLAMPTSSTLEIACNVHAFKSHIGNVMIARNYACFGRGGGDVFSIGSEDDTSTKLSQLASTEAWATGLTSSAGNVLLTLTSSAFVTASAQITYGPKLWV